MKVVRQKVPTRNKTVPFQFTLISGVVYKLLRYCLASGVIEKVKVTSIYFFLSTKTRYHIEAIQCLDM